MEKKNQNRTGKFIWQYREKQGSSDGENEILYFRKSFHCNSSENSLFLHISADSRYRLFFNGHSLLSGPCKGSEFIHYYESVDLSEYIQQGDNVLAVKVLHYPVRGENLSVRRSPLGMLFAEAELKDPSGQLLKRIETDESWLCLRDESMSFIQGQYNTMFLGGTEHVRGEKHPEGWETTAYDDSAWENCISYDLVDTSTGVLEPWQLTERPIPLLREQKGEFTAVKYSSGGEDPDDLILCLSDSASGSITVKPGSRLVLEIDAGLLTTGYPMLSLCGGAGSSIRILCAECYENAPIEIPWERDKHIRDDAEKGKLYGDSDLYYVSGWGTTDGAEKYEPFWFRTFRFIRLEIETAAVPLIFKSFTYRQTGYPLEVSADFNCSDPLYKKLWDISLNTLQNCMHESYEDCPYYEQYQYTMDTYLQTIFTYNVSGDDRLARKAIHDFHCSLMPQGLLQSRFPSLESQIIPGFNIYWIMMVHDHYLYFKDLSLVKRYTGTIDSILAWFDRHLNDRGLVNNIPPQYWQFVDWVPEWRAGRGVPAAAEFGPLTVYSLMYSAGLQKAAELNRTIGRSGIAEEYRERAKALNNCVLMECLDKNNGLFRDGPGQRLFSQHAQIWAVLAKAVPLEEASVLMEKTLRYGELAQVSYAMSFFLFRALESAGLYERTFKLWTSWKDMVAMNLTTWNEDPVTQRSDCHAWGAIPLYEFCAQILGVKPRDMESCVLIIKPEIGNLKWASGAVQTPFGIIKVDWLMEGNLFSLKIENPSAAELDIHLPGGKSWTSINDTKIQLSNMD